MAFQIKDFRSVAASMINWMRSTTNRVTDFNVGSVVRTMLEAVAAEIDELYQRMFIGLKEAIPVATYNSFDFTALPATPASGLVRVTITSSAGDITIPAGTAFSLPSGQITYTSQADVTITAGNTYGDVLVTASQAGIAGNLASGSSFTPSPAPDGFVSATNLVEFGNGTDAETEDERKLRFMAFIQSLARGTVAALLYGLKTTTIKDALGNITERVAHASVVEPYLDDPGQPISLVNCYIHNGVGSTTSALVTRAREVVHGYYENDGTAVPGWKAAGVKVEVFAATEQVLDVTGVLVADAGYDHATLVASAEDAINAYINGLDIGETGIKSEIIAIVMNISGVYNFTMSLPAGDTAVAANVKLMPGTVSIT